MKEFNMVFDFFVEPRDGGFTRRTVRGGVGRVAENTEIWVKYITYLGAKHHDDKEVMMFVSFAVRVRKNWNVEDLIRKASIVFNVFRPHESLSDTACKMSYGAGPVPVGGDYPDSQMAKDPLGFDREAILKVFRASRAKRIRSR